MNTALIGSIGRHALHDGPGIRTVVFFKGCPLCCVWCHNPEFLSPRPEVAFYSGRCIGCGDCVAACPEGAASLEVADRLDRTRCTGCGLCCEVCPGKALQLVGRKYEVEELVEILLRDRRFYEASGGGITLSGGEPAAQLDFASLLLRRLKEEGLHTILETSGFFSWEAFESKMLKWLDLIFFDLKVGDSALHRRLTGVGNEIILANLSRLVERRREDIVARIPVIPGYTAGEENMEALAGIVRKLGVRHYMLLGYHPYGISKAENVGRAVDPVMSRNAMEPEELERWRRFFDLCD